MAFQDIYTNPSCYKQHGLRKYSTVDDGKADRHRDRDQDSYDTFALNKPEFTDLLAAKRAGKIAEAVVIAVTTHAGGKYAPSYVGEIDAEKLEIQLNGVAPRSGRFGEFYTLTDYTFGDSPF